MFVTDERKNRKAYQEQANADDGGKEGENAECYSQERVEGKISKYLGENIAAKSEQRKGGNGRPVSTRTEFQKRSGLNKIIPKTLFPDEKKRGLSMTLESLRGGK